MKYTKKQIEESIKFWESELKKMDESNSAYDAEIPPMFSKCAKLFDDLYDELEQNVLQLPGNDAYDERNAILVDLVELQTRVADYANSYPEAQQK